MHVKSTYNGLPYRGKPLDLKDDDPDSLQPVRIAETKVRIFDLSLQGDLEAYAAVCHSITDGTSMLSAEERVYDPEAKSWRVFLRWIELYYTNPPEEG